MSLLVEKACRLLESRRQAAAAQRELLPRTPRGFTVALSREAGTDGTAIAQEVGKRLDWHVYDSELIKLIADEMGLRTTLLESVDERQQSWLLECVEAFMAARVHSEWVSESGFVHHLVETVLALGAHGECVIVGRGAAFILPAATTLRVRLVAPVRERIVSLSRKLGITEREAARQVQTIDRQRADFVKDHFLKDPDDPLNYDMVLNVPRLSVAQNAALIIEALHHYQERSIESALPVQIESEQRAGHSGAQK